MSSNYGTNDAVDLHNRNMRDSKEHDSTTCSVCKALQCDWSTCSDTTDFLYAHAVIGIKLKIRLPDNMLCELESRPKRVTLMDLMQLFEGNEPETFLNVIARSCAEYYPHDGVSQDEMTVNASQFESDIHNLPGHVFEPLLKAAAAVLNIMYLDEDKYPELESGRQKEIVEVVAGHCFDIAVTWLDV